MKHRMLQSRVGGGPGGLCIHPAGSLRFVSMYQVYTQQRPGKPRWALGSGAILLLITVGMAYALIEYKAAGTFELSRSGVTILLPAGWQELRDNLPTGTLLAAAHPDKEEGRAVFVFGAPIDRNNGRAVARFALRYGQTVLTEAAPSSGEFSEMPLPASKDDTLAGQPARTFILSLLSRDDDPTHCMVRVAVMPDQRLLGVALLGRGWPGPADLRLLDRICDKVKLGASETSAAERAPEGDSENAPAESDDERN